MKIYCVDTETTGLDPMTDQVCEIAAVEVSPKDGSILDVQSARLKITKSIPPEVSAVTGIVDADLVDAEEQSKIVEMLDDADVIACHNVAFDRLFLEPVLPRAKLIRWVCTLRLAKRAFPDAASHKLQALRYMMGWLERAGYSREYLSTAHAAENDTVVCALFFRHFYEMADYDVDRLVKGTNDPIMLKSMPFGKHRGSLFTVLDESYLSWASKTKFDDLDVNHTIQRELQRRGQKVPAMGDARG
jgi:exodeoxyribonuclease X